MTREEAIDVYNGLINTKIKEAFEFFAPELRENESEDERIRKDIIECVEEQIRQGNYLNINRAKVIAYLEKQKGLTTENNMISSKKCNKSPLTDEAFKEQLERVLRDNVLDTDIRITGDTVIGAKLKEYFEQKEQKPDDDPLNDPKFIKGFDTGREVQRIFDEKKPAECLEKGNEYWLGFNEGKGTVLDNPEQYGLCKPAKWNVEDKVIRKEIQDYFNKKKDYRSRWFNWVSRATTYKPAEWSKEDEKIITRLIDYFESFRIAGVATKWEGLGVQEVITLLKSLRPSWKPSEEELVALKNVGGILRDYGHGELAKMVFMIEGKLANLSVINKSIWKPSEEQMKTLEECSECKRCIKELHEQLKKLQA